MLAYCKYNGIGVIPWSPLATGALARPPRIDTARSEFMKMTPLATTLTEADITIINRVKELAEKHGKKISQVSLAWVSTKIISPIVGVSSAARLEESLTT